MLRATLQYPSDTSRMSRDLVLTESDHPFHVNNLKNVQKKGPYFFFSPQKQSLSSAPCQG